MSSSPYGYQHQKRRAALLTHAYGKPCPLCGAVMLPGQRLQLDHSIPLALGGTTGDRIVHGRCNERAGARLGNLIRGRRRAKTRRAMPTSGSF